MTDIRRPFVVDLEKRYDADIRMYQRVTAYGVNDVRNQVASYWPEYRIRRQPQPRCPVCENHPPHAEACSGTTSAGPCACAFREPDSEEVVAWI
jgi:hypothetical protein